MDLPVPLPDKLLVQDPVLMSHLWEIFSSSPMHKRSVKTAAAAAKSLQSCPTLGNPIDGSPPGSPVPGILQARTLEWVAISFSKAHKGFPKAM